MGLPHFVMSCERVNCDGVYYDGVNCDKVNCDEMNCDELWQSKLWHKHIKLCHIFPKDNEIQWMNKWTSTQAYKNNAKDFLKTRKIIFPQDFYYPNYYVKEIQHSNELFFKTSYLIIRPMDFHM